MNEIGRLNVMLKSQNSFEFMKELELRDFIARDCSLVDVLHLFTAKLVRVEGSKSLTLTLLSEFVWAILSALWDADYLIPKQNILLRQAGNDKVGNDNNNASDRANMLLEKQLDGARERIKALECDLKRSREEMVAMVERKLRFAVHSYNIEEFDASQSQIDTMCRTSSEMIEIENPPDPELGYLQTRLAALEELNRSLIQQVEESRDSIKVEEEYMDESEAPTREVTPQVHRKSYSRFPEELAIHMQRESEDELRIDQLLEELVERDEIISVVSNELMRVSKILEETGTSPRRSTAPNTQRGASIEITEKDTTIASLKLENETLRMLASDLESHTTRIILELEHMHASSVTIHEEISKSTSESVTQTDKVRVPLTTRSGPGIVVSEHGEEKILLELEEEREKTRKAIEETARVKICLSELERQLATLQFQLRKSGVKQEQIHTAMLRSGLNSLMRANRAAVFERLYQDAVDRMKRMEKIREQVKQIQARQFLKKYAVHSSGNEPEFPHSLVGRSNESRHQVLGGGFMAGLHTLQRRVEKYKTLSCDLRRVLSINCIHAT